MKGQCEITNLRVRTSEMMMQDNEIGNKRMPEMTMAMFSPKLSLYCQMELYYGMQMVSGLDMRACSFVIYGVLYNADVCGEKFPVTTAEFAQ